MKLEKQDVFIKSKVYNKHNECVLVMHDFSTSFAVCLKDVFILTETQLEMLKNEYYAIGLKETELNKK
jgi:hypothetical protein